MAAIMLWTSSSAQASWRTSVTSVRAGRGAGRGRFSSGARTRFQSATADAGEVRAVSSVVPGSRAILGVGALLQAAMLVRRLRSAAAGERDAAECRLLASSSHRPVAGHHVRGPPHPAGRNRLDDKRDPRGQRHPLPGTAPGHRPGHPSPGRPRDLHATGRIDRRPAGVTAGPARHGKATPVRLHTHELAAAKPGSLSHLGAPGLQPPDQSAQRRRR